MINYESVVLSLSQGKALREPLAPVYPRDGIVTADYPLMLLKDERRATYDKLVTYLRSPPIQKTITESTLRRPIVPEVEPAAAIPRRTLAELPFPASRELLDHLIEAYQGELRRPASTYFVIDTSGSMKGEGIGQLRTALQALAGADPSLSGRFARFQPRERIYILAFAGRPGTAQRYELPKEASKVTNSLATIAAFAQSLRADGGTAIFSSVRVALEAAAQDRRADPDRAYSIVVMTDGRNESGMTEDEFKRWYEQLPMESRGIRVFALLFGNAEKRQLQQIAELTDGRLFDARKSLHLAFKEIRGYQ